MILISKCHFQQVCFPCKNFSQLFLMEKHTVNQRNHASEYRTSSVEMIFFQKLIFKTDYKDLAGFNLTMLSKFS